MTRHTNYRALPTWLASFTSTLTATLAVLLTTATTACGPAATTGNGSAPLQAIDALASHSIYGKDGRLEPFESAHQDLRSYARNTGILVDQKLVPADEAFELGGKSLATWLTERYRNDRLCDTVRFQKQPNPGKCSGFLVSPTVFVTAGHCVDGGPEELKSLRVILNYAYSTTEAAAKGEAIRVDRDKQVFGFKRLLSIRYTPLPPGTDKPVIDSYGEPETVDFAFVELDRPAPFAQVFALELKPQSRPGDPIALVGYPNGLPLKIAEDAAIRADEGLIYFSNLDGFHGNSGSPVINLRTRQVIGIYVTTSHYDEWTYEMNGGCTRPLMFADDFAGRRPFEGTLKLATAWNELGERAKREILGKALPPIPRNARLARVTYRHLLTGTRCGDKGGTAVRMEKGALVQLLGDARIVKTEDYDQAVRVRLLRNPDQDPTFAAPEGCEGLASWMLLERVAAK